MRSDGQGFVFQQPLRGATLLASRLDTLNERLVTTFRDLLEGLEDGTIVPDPGVTQGVLDDVRGLVAALSPA